MELLSKLPFQIGAGGAEAKAHLSGVDGFLESGAELRLSALGSREPELHRLMLLTTTDTSTLLEQARSFVL